MNMPRPAISVTCCTPALHQTIRCESCGDVVPVTEADAKPEDPRNPDDCTWGIVHCRRCYGPDFCPSTGGFAPVQGWRRPAVSVAAWCRRAWFSVKG